MIVENLTFDQVSQVSPAEISALTRMHNRLSQENTANSAWSDDTLLSMYREKIARNEILVLVGREGGEEAGYAWFQAAHEEIWLKEIFIQPPWRTKDRYAALIAPGLDWLQAKGATICRYSAIERDTNLGEALLSCGFVLEEEHILMQTSLAGEPGQLPELDIRSFSEVGDPGWLSNFIQECLECHPIYDRQDILDVIKRRDNLSFVAYAASQPAGFIIGETHPRRNAAAGQAIFYVEEIGVHPAFRRQGIASSMLAVAFERARLAGLQAAHLHVVSNNLPGLRLYQKLGFNEVERSGWWVYTTPAAAVSRPNENNL